MQQTIEIKMEKKEYAKQTKHEGNHRDQND